jgi:hypothetical protein
MIWTVSWVPTAWNELATLWINGSDRQAISKAADAIDAGLRRDPYANSESREGNDRVIFKQPLGIRFSVSDADRLVTVRAVWRI